MTRNAMKGFDGAVAGLATLQSRAGSGLSAIDKHVRGSEAYKTSVENGEMGKLRRFMKKYDGKSNAEIEEDLAKNPSKRRRFMRNVGTLSKDAQQSAIIGAAMSQYRFNTDPANMARANISAMRGEDENQKKQVMSEFVDQNMSMDNALFKLNDMQEYKYAEHTAQENHDHDIRMTALQSYLMSNKEGRKKYNEYLQGKTISTASGKNIESANTRMSERARAVYLGILLITMQIERMSLGSASRKCMMRKVAALLRIWVHCLRPITLPVDANLLLIHMPNVWKLKILRLWEKRTPKSSVPLLGIIWIK